MPGIIPQAQDGVWEKFEKKKEVPTEARRGRPHNNSLPYATLLNISLSALLLFISVSNQPFEVNNFILVFQRKNWRFIESKQFAHVDKKSPAHRKAL